jgi:coenzyme F420-reducing hydrogenase delta subunit/NAD-dependent dihydropyrimidine dehydrogenase PreA subunit
MEIRPDVIVVDEAIEPSPYLRDLIRLFELEQDRFGFAQADNVHRLAARTNRNGIHVIGPSRMVPSPRATVCDAADSALICLNALDAPLDPPAEARAVIDRRQCIRCLTCYRLCPYRAVELENPMRVAPAACAQCGICIAECPRGAIGMPGIAAADITAPLKTAPVPEGEGTHEPVLVVLGCARSAIHAGQTAACLGEKFPPGLHRIEVPCAGSVSQQVLLDILHGHADGVLVIGCHPDNCHSTQGTLRARQCVRALRRLLPDMGIDAERLQYRTLAANMATEFTRMISTFRDQIRAMAPNRLRISRNAKKG